MKNNVRNLSVDIRGENVKLLQKKLNLLGYSIEDKDGFFGSTTRRAVLELQKKHGMEATGIVDERTAGLIAGELEVRKVEVRRNRSLSLCEGRSGRQTAVRSMGWRSGRLI